MEEDTQFLLKRAKEEATRAIRSEDERAADAHQRMAVRYSAKALIQLADQDANREGSDDSRPQVIEEPKSFPR